MRGVTEMQAHIGKLVLLDTRQHLGHGIDESVAADEAGARMFRRLRKQMLAAAKADFQADLLDLVGKQRPQVGRRGSIGIDRNPRQQRFK